MSTRQLGFKLVTIGNDKTLSELDKVNKKMDELASKIKAIQKTPIKLSTAFDTKGLNDLLKTLEKVDKAKLNPQILSTIKELKTQLGQLEKQVLTTQTKLDKVSIPELTDVQVNKINGSFVKLNGSAAKVMESIAKLKPGLAAIDDEQIKKTYDTLAKVEARLKSLKEERKVILTSKNTSEVETATVLDPLIQEQKLLIAQKAQLEKQSKATAKALFDENKNLPTDSIIALRTELNKLSKEYYSLSQAQRESSEGQALKNRINELTNTVSASEQAIGNFRRNVGNYQSALSGLLPKLKELESQGVLAGKGLDQIFKGDLIRREQELRAEIEKLGNELNELGDDITKTADRARVFSTLDDRLKEFTNVRGQLDQLGSSFDRLGGKFLRVSDIITGGLIGGGLIGLVTAITQGVKQTISLNTALSDVEADVRKTTGLTADEVNSLTAAFKKIDTRTSTQDLLKIAAVAGQLGVQGTEGVEAFTKSVDVLNVALGDELPGGVDEIAGRISKLSNVLFGVSSDGEQMAERMLFIGNALNVLSASSAATSDKIIDFSSRIGRSLAPLNVSAEQVLALSATFDELSILPEQGATAINNLIKDIGANTKLFADTLKLNQDDLRQAFNTDPIKAFDLVLKQVLNLSGGDNTKVLSLLKNLKQTGEGVSGVFLQLGTNAELYERNLKLSSKAILETSSIFNEFKIKNENLASVFDKISKKLQDFATDPAIVNLVDLLGKILTGTIGIVSEVYGAFSATFDRLTTDVSEQGTKLEGSLTGVTTSALSMSEAQFTVLKSVSSVNAILKKEQTILESSIKILSDETSSRVARNKAIDTLLEKYPGLISKYQLEGASNKELIALQSELTEVLKREVFNRIKLKNDELLATQEINLLQRQSELELGEGLGTIQGGLANLFGVREKVITIEKENVRKQLEDLRLQTEKSVAIFDKTAEKLNINFTETFGNLNYDKVRSNLAGLIKLIEQEIDKNQIDKKTNAILIGVSGAATEIINKLKLDAPESQLKSAYETTINLQKEFENAIGSSNKELKTEVDLKILGGDATKKDLKSTKEIADQLERIEELRRRIVDLNLDSIANKFDKNIAEVKVNTVREIEEIQKELDKLELKKIKTNADQIEINTAKQLIETLKKAEDAAITQIEGERNDALKKAANELKTTQEDILKLIREINKTEIDIKINQSEFDLKQATRSIEIDFETNIDGLKKQLADGLITQDQYNDLIENNEAEKLDALAKLQEAYTQEFINQLNIRYDAEVKLAEQLKNSELTQAKIEFDTNNEEIQLQLDEGELTIAQAFAKRLQNQKEYKTNVEQIDQKYRETKQNLDQELVTGTQEVLDKGVEATRAAADARFNIELAADNELTEKKKRNLEILKNEAIGFAEELSNTLFDIENEKSERLFESQKSRLEKNYDNQIKLAEGNTQEIARLEAQKVSKIEELEKQQARKRKEQAIKEAIIAGALAIIKSITNPIAIPFIVAGVALQIARIKAQSFAKGGLVKRYGGFTGRGVLAPDETGERPVDAQVHEGEFVSTRKQVSKNKWLYDILDADRNRVNAGASTDLEQSIADSLIKRRQTIFNLEQSSKPKRITPIIPYIIPLGTNVKNSLELSDDQLDRMAEVLGARIAQKSGQAIYNGTTEGIKQATKQTLRFERTQKRKFA